jgi:arylsulfatase A-like enzyme
MGEFATLAQPPPHCQWPDCRVRERLGWIHGRHPEEQRDGRRGAQDYGYHTAAWGKWHNTPAEQTTAAGPFDDWPTGYGFQYFYGFLGGEASQYEPH